MKAKLLLILCIVASTCIAASEYRTFTSQDGKTIQAKLVSFNSKSGAVTLERSNRKKAVISPDIFSSEDQEYIRKWIAASQIKEKSNFKIIVDESESDYSSRTQIEVANNQYEFTQHKRVQYTINIQNLSNIRFENITIDYCAFIKRRGHGPVKNRNYCETGSLEISLQPNTSSAFQTEEILAFDLLHRGGESDGFGNFETSLSKKASEDIQGIIFHMYYKDVPEQAMEFSYPSNIHRKFNWGEFPTRNRRQSQGLF